MRIQAIVPVFISFDEMIKEWNDETNTYPRSVFFDICPVLMEFHNVQMLQLDQIVKHGFDFFLWWKQEKKWNTFIINEKSHMFLF